MTRTRVTRGETKLGLFVNLTLGHIMNILGRKCYRSACAPMLSRARRLSILKMRGLRDVRLSSARTNCLESSATAPKGEACRKALHLPTQGRVPPRRAQSRQRRVACAAGQGAVKAGLGRRRAAAAGNNADKTGDNEDTEIMRRPSFPAPLPAAPVSFLFARFSLTSRREHDRHVPCTRSTTIITGDALMISGGGVNVAALRGAKSPGIRGLRPLGAWTVPAALTARRRRGPVRRLARSMRWGPFSPWSRTAAGGPFGPCGGGE
jgi:hypothetical protein